MPREVRRGILHGSLTMVRTMLKQKLEQADYKPGGLMPPFRKRQFVFASCLAGLIGIIWYIAYATVAVQLLQEEIGRRGGPG